MKMLFSESLFLNSILFITIFAVIINLYFKWRFQYWKRRNVEYLKPSIPFGNISDVSKDNEHVWVKAEKIYNIAKKRGWKHIGIYHFAAPVYMPIDLDLIKTILVKDFHYFVDRGTYYNEKDDPLSAHLINISGTKWKNLRAKLTPTFTAGKIKMMFQTIAACEANLRRRMTEECEKNAPIDIKKILECFTTDVIGSCAFGLDCKMLEEEASPFRFFAKELFVVPLHRALQQFFAGKFPNIARALGIREVPEEISNFFTKLVKDTISYREKNNVTRKDFLQLVIDLKNNGCEDGTTLTFDEIVAQCYVFFIAGFETSATTMSFVLYMLSKHQDIQDRVRREIETVLAKYDEKITYEAIQEMKYLSQVIDETFRIQPSVASLARKCVKDYRVPGTNAIIEKGTTITISIRGIHHDEEYYPNPDKFDPERFSEENKSLRHSFAHIPFGEGPRICIGMRFALMQTKIGLTSLLKNFKFTLNPKTKEPLCMNPRVIIVESCLDGIWLNVQKIQ